MRFDDFLYYMHMSKEELNEKLREVADFVVNNPPADGKLKHTQIIALVTSVGIDPRYMEEDDFEYLLRHIQKGLSEKGMYISKT